MNPTTKANRATNRAGLRMVRSADNNGAAPEGAEEERAGDRSASGRTLFNGAGRRPERFVPRSALQALLLPIAANDDDWAEVMRPREAPTDTNASWPTPASAWQQTRRTGR